MSFFDDLFHKNRQERNRQGRERNARMNENAPDPYGSSYRGTRPDARDPSYWPGGDHNLINRGNFNQEKYDADLAAYENSYRPNDVTFDETGRPIVNGKPIGRPGSETGLDYQYLVEQEAERRRNTKWEDAQNEIRQGLNLFQSYRPGGSAALASGLFNQSASMYGTQALNIVAPDMLSEYRNQQLEDAKRERNRARDFSEKMAVSQFLSNPLGLFNSGPTPQNTPTPNPEPSNPAPTPTPGSNVPPGSSAPAAAGTGGATFGAGGGGGMMVGPGGEILAGDRGQYSGLTTDSGGGQASNIRRAGGGSGVSADGGFGAGGSAGGPVGAGGGGGGRRMGGGQGSGMGGFGGGGPPISTYANHEVATRAQMSAPGSTEAITSSWTGSTLRSDSVGLRVASARSELLDAIGVAGSPYGSLLSLLI